MKSSLLAQLKKRRKALGLKQHDMLLQVGISRQQYQRLESKGNPRLSTLALVALGLKSEIMLIPKEKLDDVNAVLDGKMPGNRSLDIPEGERLSDNPWKGLLGDDE